MCQQNTFRNTCQLILGEIRSAVDAVDPDQVAQLIEAILAAEKVFVVGVGRVMLSLSAIAKRLNHLGISTHCVGDINEPAITDHDLLIVGSGSGESVVPVAIAKVARTHHAKIAYLGSNMESTVARLSNVRVRIPVQTKLHLPDEIPSRQIMTSLFEQSLFILGEAISLEIAKQRDLDIKQLWRHHANLE